MPFRKRSVPVLPIVVGAFLTGMFIARDLLTVCNSAHRIHAGLGNSLSAIGDLQLQAREALKSAFHAGTMQDASPQVLCGDDSPDADCQRRELIARSRAPERMLDQIKIGNCPANDWKAYLRVLDMVLGFSLEGLQNAGGMDRTSSVLPCRGARREFGDIERLYKAQASRETVRVALTPRPVFRVAGELASVLLFGMITSWVLWTNQKRRGMHPAERNLDFVSLVSHEMRTPLMTILYAGENVRDGCPGGSQELKEQGSIIVEQANRLQELFDKILVFAETTNNRPECTARALEVSEVIDGVLKNMAALIGKSGFTVETKIQPGLPRIVGDLSLISRCLQNLVANAVKYSDKERWVGLSATLDESAADGRKIQISVRDRGIGIPSSDLPRIFEPFYRSSRVVAAQIHGAGLGLAIAKSSAEALEATLSVTSEVDRGSVFTLQVPVVDE